jgi:hypothetical protein
MFTTLIELKNNSYELLSKECADVEQPPIPMVHNPIEDQEKPGCTHYSKAAFALFLVFVSMGLVGYLISEGVDRVRFNSKLLDVCLEKFDADSCSNICNYKEKIFVKKIPCAELKKRYLYIMPNNIEIVESKQSLIYFLSAGILFSLVIGLSIPALCLSQEKNEEVNY